MEAVARPGERTYELMVLGPGGQNVSGPEWRWEPEANRDVARRPLVFDTRLTRIGS
jgi:hypothetical protein